MATGKNAPVERSKSAVPAGGLGSLASLRDEIDSLFDDFFRGGFPAARRFFDLDPFRRPVAGAVAPRVDVAETADAYTITADMPGLDEKDIQVTLADDVLTFSGEKKEEREEKDKDFHLVERRYGAFQRGFRLPGGVDANKISASCEKGVLVVTMPKNPAKKAETKTI